MYENRSISKQQRKVLPYLAGRQNVEQENSFKFHCSQGQMFKFHSFARIVKREI